MDDLTERAWWVYEMPDESIVYVPAPSEGEARNQMRATHYKDAPVDSYPFIASRWTSRAALVKSILGRPVIGAGEAPRKDSEGT